MFFKLLLSVGVLSCLLHSVESSVAPTSLSTFVSGAGGVRFIGEAGGLAGYAVSMIGDYNKDGTQDFAVAAPRATVNGKEYCGLVLIVLGRAGAWTEVDMSTVSSGLTMRRIIGAAASDFAGRIVASAGDLNKDGYADLMLGAPYADPSSRSDAGTIYVIFGKASTVAYTDVELGALTSATGFKVLGANKQQNLGSLNHVIRSLGDVNGDSIDDIAVCDDIYDYSSRYRAGTVWVIFGKTTTFANIDLASFSGGVVLGGPDTLNNLGVSIDNVGDFNGDGKKDLLIGAYQFNSNSLTARGVAYLIYGSTSFPSRDMASFVTGAAGIRFLGGKAFDNAGSCVSGAGDINADGKADILIAADSADPPGRNNGGKVYVIFGFSAQLSADFDLGTLVAGVQGYTVLAPLKDMALGTTLSRAGDLDQDGILDFVVGSNIYAPAPGVYVIYGIAGTPTADIDLLTYTGKVAKFESGSASDYLPQSLSGGVDVNGDGIPDLLMGGPNTAVVPAAGGASRANAGAAYLIHGPIYPPTSEPTASPSFTASPSEVPSASPSETPSQVPSADPSAMPSEIPSFVPSVSPSETPSFVPSVSPSNSASPSAVPSFIPSAFPSIVPSCAPSVVPSADPSASPSTVPSAVPTLVPSIVPSEMPTQLPSVTPSATPTEVPSAAPSVSPSVVPSFVPSAVPSVDPSPAPSASPSVDPSVMPSVSPSNAPSAVPSLVPSAAPSVVPSHVPSASPSVVSSHVPTVIPTAVPSAGPSVTPSAVPTQVPSERPTVAEATPFETVLGVEQVMYNVSKADCDAQKVQCNLTIQHTIAEVIDGVIPERVTDIAVEEEEEEGGRRLRNTRSLATTSTPRVLLRYKVTVYDPLLTFEVLSAQLKNKVQTGEMASKFHSFALLFNATGLLAGSFAEPQVTHLNYKSGRAVDPLNAGEIAGLVFGSFVFLALLAAGVWVAVYKLKPVNEKEGQVVAVTTGECVF